MSASSISKTVTLKIDSFNLTLNDPGTVISEKLTKLSQKINNLLKAPSSSQSDNRFNQKIIKLLTRSLPYIIERKTITDFALPYVQSSSKEALHVALLADDTNAISQAINQGADINVPITDNISPLLFACKYGSSVTVSFLLSQGASPHFIGGTHDHQTPLSEARLRPDTMSPCLEQLTLLDDGFTDEFLKMKIIAHECSLPHTRSFSHDSRFFSLTNSEKTISYNPLGARPRLIHNLSKHKFAPLEEELSQGSGPLLDQLNFAPLTPDLYPAILSGIGSFKALMERCIQEGIDEAHLFPDKLISSMIKRLDRGELVLSFGVTPSSYLGHRLHAWGLCFRKELSTGDYVADLCNRGAEAGAFPGILTKKFNKEKLLELLHQYVIALNWKRILKQAKVLRNVSQQFQDNFLNYIKGKEQSTRNCCYTSYQALTRAALTSLFEPMIGKEQAPLLAKRINQLCTHKLRSDRLIPIYEDLLNKNHPDKTWHGVWEYQEKQAFLGETSKLIAQAPEEHQNHQALKLGFDATIAHNRFFTAEFFISRMPEGEQKNEACIKGFQAAIARHQFISKSTLFIKMMPEGQQKNEACQIGFEAALANNKFAVAKELVHEMTLLDQKNKACQIGCEAALAKNKFAIAMDFVKAMTHVDQKKEACKKAANTAVNQCNFEAALEFLTESPS